MIGKNKLKNYETIINNAAKKPLVDSLVAICESRYPDIKLYDKIDKSDIEIINMPTYQDLYFEDHELDIKDTESFDTVEELKKESMNLITQNAFGIGGIFAILGVVLVMIGILLSIIHIF